MSDLPGLNREDVKAMTISSHPDFATLMTCSAGSTPEALCAVVTSHLSMCPVCLNELRSMESIGVALFDQLEPVKLQLDALPTNTAANEDGLARAHAAAVHGDVPRPLVEVIGNSLDALPWQRLAPGIWNFSVPMTVQTKGDLRLIKLESGAILPEHRHEGEQLILVLRGSYRSDEISHGVGDFAELDDESKHAMVAETNGCILLIGNEAMPDFIAKIA